MKSWFTPAEIAVASHGELPATVQGINQYAEKRGWRRQDGKARKAPGRGGGWEYHLSLLPGDVQARLRVKHAPDEPVKVPPQREALWQRFEGLSKKQKDECRRRLALLDEIERLSESGALGETAASRVVARREGISVATLYNWKSRLRGIDRADRLAALAPEYRGKTSRSECHPDAWTYLKSELLRAERPAFSACYRRLLKAASREGWQPIPTERALRDRFASEVPAEVRILARKGRDAAKALYPAQQRSVAHMHAMQAVNMDGHKLDLFVRIGGIEKPARVHLITIQDVYSRKIVAWRLAESENKHDVRLAIGDMVEAFGIPDAIYLDNGRSFASKWITGGTANRYRFKVREEEPSGLLTTLGVDVHWTSPYSGQSKPIERAFRTLAEEICKHPLCAGAYTGNRPDAKPENYGKTAIPFETLRDHVAAMIAEHNAQPGRMTETAVGRSYDETFEESIARPSTIVRWPTAAQRSLWLLAAEQVRAQKGRGEIHFMGNRYWSRGLIEFAARRVTVRFDPMRLIDDLNVYDAEDRLICRAECIEAVGFDDMDAARRHAARRNQFLRTAREMQRLHAELAPDELARATAEVEGERQSRNPVKPAITRIATGGNSGGGAAAARIAEADEELEANFSKGLRIVAGTTFED